MNFSLPTTMQPPPPPLSGPPPPLQPLTSAPDRLLPQAHFYSIEYPGYVRPSSVPQAIQNLGGQATIDRVFKRPAQATGAGASATGAGGGGSGVGALLELSLRPGNPFAHPVPGDVVAANNLLMKVTRRRRKRRDGMEVDVQGQRQGDAGRDENGGEEGEYTAEVIGVLAKTARFRSMVDYQYFPDPQDPVSRLRTALDTMDVEALCEYVIPPEPVDGMVHVAPVATSPPVSAPSGPVIDAALIDPALTSNSTQNQNQTQNLVPTPTTQNATPTPTTSVQNNPLHTTDDPMDTTMDIGEDGEDMNLDPALRTISQAQTLARRQAQAQAQAEQTQAELQPRTQAQMAEMQAQAQAAQTQAQLQVHFDPQLYLLPLPLPQPEAQTPAQGAVPTQAQAQMQPKTPTIPTTSVLRLFPPPLFSRQTIPQGYNFKANTASMISTAVDEETGEERKRLINRMRWKGYGPASIMFADAHVPDKPPQAVQDGRHQISETILAKLEVLFKDRPIWTRQSLFNQFSPSEARDILNSKLLLPLCCYVFQDGPWRDTLVRFLYDPRKDPSSRFYQRLYFRNANHPISRPSVTARRQTRTGLNEQMKDDVERKTSHIFDGQTITKETAAFQLCDITDPMLKEMIEDPDALRETCNDKDGWYTTHAFEQIKTVLRHKFFSLLEGHPATDAECQALLVASDGSVKAALAHRSAKLRAGKHNMAKGALRPEDAAALRLRATLDRSMKSFSTQRQT